MATPIRRFWNLLTGLIPPVSLVFLLTAIGYRNPNWKLVYVTTFYPFWSHVLRRVFGWMPFSFGDVLYVIAGSALLRGMVLFAVQSLRNHRVQWMAGGRILRACCWLYALFLLQWGYNYHIDRIGRDFGIQEVSYSTAELLSLCDSLAQRTNQYHRIIAGSDTAMTVQQYPFDSVRANVLLSYAQAHKKYPFLRYAIPSIKGSMLSPWLNYAGITGYYNPLSGEAQLNVSIPPLSLPFSACHEVAHQIGFAPEQSANFVGYVVANHSAYPYFRYSANSELFLYAMQNLAWMDDSLARKELHVLIVPGVWKDYQSEFAFYDRYNGSFERDMNAFYDQYLKANQQMHGMESYDDVVGLLMAYVTRYGHMPD